MCSVCSLHIINGSKTERLFFQYLTTTIEFSKDVAHVIEE